MTLWSFFSIPFLRRIWGYIGSSSVHKGPGEATCKRGKRWAQLWLPNHEKRGAYLTITPSKIMETLLCSNRDGEFKRRRINQTNPYGFMGSRPDLSEWF